MDNDNSNTSSAAVESENYPRRSTADLLESSSDSSDNEAEELDVSFTERNSTKTCLGVTCEPIHVSTTTADRPLSNATNLTNMKLAATRDIDNDDDDDDDHRHFIGSDRPFGDFKQHDAHISESVLVSHVAMDIN